MPLYRSSQPEPPSRSASRLNSTPFREEQSKKKTTPSVAQPRCFKGQPEPRRTNSRLLQTSVLFGKHREATSPLAAPFCSLTTRIPSLGARSLSLAWTALPGIWLGLALPGSPDQGSSIRTEAALCAFPCFPPRSRLHSILLSLLWPRELFPRVLTCNCLHGFHHRLILQPQDGSALSISPKFRTGTEIETPTNPQRSDFLGPRHKVRLPQRHRSSPHHRAQVPPDSFPTTHRRVQDPLLHNGRNDHTAQEDHRPAPPHRG